MAVPTPDTVITARNEVMARLSLDPSLSMHGGGTVAMVDSYIRQQDRFLYFERHWTILRRFLEVPLIKGQKIYDWPDETDPGQIESIRVFNEDGERVTLQPRDDVRSIRDYPQQTIPEWYTYINNEIHIYPAPGEKWVRMEIDYIRGYERPIESDDELNCDLEAVVGLTTIAVGERLGDPVPQRVATLTLRYIDRMKAQNSNKSGIKGNINRSRYVTRITERNSDLEHARYRQDQRLWDE